MGLLVSTLAHTIPTLASQIRQHLTGQFPLASPLFFFYLSFSLYLCLSYLCLSYFSLARCPSVLMCHEPCAAQDRHTFSVTVSNFARERARFGKSYEMPRDRLSRDHDKMLARYLLLEICPCGSSVLGNVFLPRCKHVAKVTSLTEHLVQSCTWVDDSAQRRCHTMSTFLLVPIHEHSPRFESVTSKNQGTQRVSFNFVINLSELFCSPTRKESASRPS